MTKTKPAIVVLSADSEKSFRWLSDGWNEMKTANSPKARGLMKKANRCIDEAADIPDAIIRLKKAGFEIVRQA